MFEDLDWSRVLLFALIGAIIGGITGWKKFRTTADLVGKTYGSLGTVLGHGVGIGKFPLYFSQEAAQDGTIVNDIHRWQTLDTVVLEEASSQQLLYVTPDGMWGVDVAGNLVVVYPKSMYQGPDLLQLVSDAGF